MATGFVSSLSSLGGHWVTHVEREFCDVSLHAYEPAKKGGQFAGVKLFFSPRFLIYGCFQFCRHRVSEDVLFMLFKGMVDV